MVLAAGTSMLAESALLSAVPAASFLAAAAAADATVIDGLRR
ncbi:hypothetical protein [Actinomadura sp. NBRC 104412]|nr:hypothetical protein [Actinomadura sp. NBRC 104412]